MCAEYRQRLNKMARGAADHDRRSTAGTKVLLANRIFVMERIAHAAHSDSVRAFQNETHSAIASSFSIGRFDRSLRRYHRLPPASLRFL